MKQSEKLDLICRILYELKDSKIGLYYPSFWRGFSLPAQSTWDLIHAKKALMEKELIDSPFPPEQIESCVQLTYKGVEFVESNSFSCPGVSVLEVTEIEVTGELEGKITIHPTKYRSKILTSPQPVPETIDKRELKKRIAKGEAQKVLKFLLGHILATDGEFLNRVVGISERLNRSHKNFRQGMIGIENLNTQNNMIIQDLLNLVDELAE